MLKWPLECIVLPKPLITFQEKKVIIKLTIKLSKSSSYFSDDVGFWKGSVDNNNFEVITIISTVKSKTKTKDLSY